MFVNAPHVLVPVNFSCINGASEAPRIDDLRAPEAETATNPALAPRSWWKYDPADVKTVGLEASLMYLRDVLLRDQYDVRHATPGETSHQSDTSSARVSSDSGVFHEVERNDPILKRPIVREQRWPPSLLLWYVHHFLSICRSLQMLIRDSAARTSRSLPTIFGGRESSSSSGVSCRCLV